MKVMSLAKLAVPFCAFLIAFSTRHSHAQVPVGALDSLISVHYAGQFNGGILVAQDDKIVLRKSLGKADFAAESPNTPDTKFNLASISKAITSTAILQLEEKGKLKIKDPVQKYLPDFPYPSITVWHLLTHTSGLPDLERYEDIVKQFPDSVIDNRAIVPTLRSWSKPLPFAPGDKWQYCNTNFDLLAVLIEKVSGMSYPKYLEKNIFKPAGMNQSFVQSGPYGQRGAVPHVYSNWFTNTYVPADSIPRFKYINYNISGLIGSTNIITTLNDMLNFDRAFFSGRLLRKQTIEKALTPVRLNDGSIFYEGSMDTMLGEGKGSYGMGWSLYEQPGLGKSAGHGGFNYGLATFYFHNLEKNQTIIAYDNTASTSFSRVVSSAFFLMNGLKPIETSNRSSLARLYGTTIKENGMDEAMVLFNDLKTDTARYYVSERELNFLGYDLLRAGFIELATEVFKVNTLLFPASFNVYDSFAEALLKAGKKKEAILMYQKSLKINPENKGAREALDKIKNQELP